MVIPSTRPKELPAGILVIKAPLVDGVLGMSAKIEVA